MNKHPALHGKQQEPDLIVQNPNVLHPDTFHTVWHQDGLRGRTVITTLYETIAFPGYSQPAKAVLAQLVLTPQAALIFAEQLLKHGFIMESVSTEVLDRMRVRCREMGVALQREFDVMLDEEAKKDKVLAKAAARAARKATAGPRAEKDFKHTSRNQRVRAKMRAKAKVVPQ